MDIDIDRAKELIAEREKIDEELRGIFNGKQRKSAACSICGSAEHTARNCPEKNKNPAV